MAPSPCGWYRPLTSPTIWADFVAFRSDVRFESWYIVYRMGRWTGLRTSRISGSARPVTTDMAYRMNRLRASVAIDTVWIVSAITRLVRSPSGTDPPIMDWRGLPGLGMHCY